MQTSLRPWHQVVQLRDELRSGELSLSLFAADLYDVAMGRAPKVYQDPAEFFAFTYPTFNLRELAKDVVLRLAGQSDKAVRQLELTYGGGKTHALITLFHLVSTPGLPKTPSVHEFAEHIGMTPPQARVAVLSFDKLDVEKGMEVKSPTGETRWLKHPWSVLAWQLAGAEGLKLIHADNRDEERQSAPAENLLSELLALPGREGLSILLLLDEVLMYAREKVALDPVWRSRLQNFFQYLAQAVTKTNRCALVVSLLASDPRKGDELGREIAKEFYDVFRREQEEGIQPVVKEDVAEILRRRLFTADSVREKEAFKPNVVAAVRAIASLDDETAREGPSAEQRYLQSYPFHPDLTEVFYAKWTQLEGFQRTRGILRTFALALRAAEKWDQSPLAGPNVFLAEPEEEEIAGAARELSSVAATEEYEGKRHEWSSILQGELAKARAIERELGTLRFRELEQVVLATFIHSQPVGQKAFLQDLLVLVGATRPDRIELEKGLRRWMEVSWFLDESAFEDVEPGQAGGGGLPKTWRLGTKPNLRQMFSEYYKRLTSSPNLIEARLVDEIRKTRSLTDGAAAAGVRVHKLPDGPADLDDTPDQFHYCVLGPGAASVPGNPSQEARRFLEETTGPDRPRVHRNAVVLAVPSREGLEAARNAVREYLAWEDVREALKAQELDPVRAGRLAKNLSESKKAISTAVRQAYGVVVTVSERNEVQAFKITPGDDSLFNLIKADPRTRIQETPITAEALLPGGPYDLWREGENARRVKDLVDAFAQFPHLPKMLSRQAILDTLVAGVREGVFVLRALRPDRSIRTLWRTEPTSTDLEAPELEAVLPEAAELTELSPDLLVPGDPASLPELWADPARLEVGEIVQYFSGGRTVTVQRDGYEELQAIPAAPREVVERAVAEAVQSGKLWLVAGPASIWREQVPPGVLTDTARLLPPPEPVAPLAILEDQLPSAWRDGRTTALSILTALSQKAGETLPWPLVQEAIEGALRVRLIERSLESGPWPCPVHAAASVVLERAAEGEPQPVPGDEGTGSAWGRAAEATLQLNQLQDLADVGPSIVEVAAGYDPVFHVRVELHGRPDVPAEVIERLNQLLAPISEELRVEG